VSSANHTVKNIFKMGMVQCCLLLSSCIHTSYPPSWPAPVKDDGAECPDISGRFHNRPSAATVGGPKDPRPNGGGLYDELTGEGHFGRHSCNDCVVELQWRDDSRDALRISLVFPDTTTSSHKHEEKTLHRSRGDFKCSDGGLSVAFTQGAELVMAGGVERINATYWLTQDGSLIRYEKVQGVRHSVVIPYAFSLEDYALWSRAE